MKTIQEYITPLRRNANALRVQYGITSMSIFGSVARGNNIEGSDLDLFVEMPPRLFQISAAKRYIEELLGCPIDIVRNHSHIDNTLLTQIQKDGVHVF